jgi:hypothetical protein
MTQHPEIDYRHVLSELSVNRKDPCEVIRELISNSYDAQASRIEIYPLLNYSGFIFFDNGIGLSETEQFNGITPYRAFFSIGKSTKIQGEAIGYKCQGSKLCFASKKFTLITRCKNEDKWRSRSIDNPKDNLSPQYDIQSNVDSNPWQTLKDLFPTPKKQTTNILNNLNEDFFNKNFTSGTMIIVQSLDVEKFSSYYNSEEDGITKWSYIKNYIRFNTRHGDMRILRSSETDFPASKATMFQQCPGYNDQCELYIWTEDTSRKKEFLQKIEAGYPYLHKPNDMDTSLIRTPAEVSTLNAGRFSARGAATFSFEGITYCLALAIDGNRRCHEKYEELDRKVTNRNSLTETALRILNDDNFIEKIKQFFDAAKANIQVFRELVDRLNKETQDVKLEAYTRKLDALKQGIKDRPIFMVDDDDIEQLKGKWLVEPGIGEEYSVGTLYAMFAHLVPLDSLYSDIWLRPRTFSSMGIDSIAVSIGENTLGEKVHKALEYKYIFSPSDEFNHPLILTAQIVCWDMPSGQEKDNISDSYNFFGEISYTQELNQIGYEIINIRSREGDFYPGKVKVISLKRLLDKTFNCKWVTPPPLPASKTKKGKKR